MIAGCSAISFDIKSGYSPTPASSGRHVTRSSRMAIGALSSRLVRVIVPGLRHFYSRFAPGRLYDVPVKLGHLDRPLLETELTPFLPHT